MNNLPNISVPSVPNIHRAAEALAQGNEPDATASSGFKELLLDSIQNVNQMQVDADKAVETLFTGGDTSPAEVLTAVQKADMAFRLTMQMRNKMMEVYQEIRDIRI